MCPHLLFLSFNVLVAFRSLSKSSVLVRSSIGPFRSFLYFGILLYWLPLAVGRLSCCQFAGHCWKRDELSLFVGRSFFLHACVTHFSCQRPLGVSAYFNIFLKIQFKLFIYLFIPYTVSPQKGCVSSMTLNYIWWWGSSSGDPWSVEYFIAITPRSSLFQNVGVGGMPWCNGYYVGLRLQSKLVQAPVML